MRSAQKWSEGNLVMGSKGKKKKVPKVKWLKTTLGNWMSGLKKRIVEWKVNSPQELILLEFFKSCSQSNQLMLKLINESKPL